MSKLRLGPIVEDKPVKLTVELPGTLLRHLGDYAKTMRARMASPNHSPSTTYAGAVHDSRRGLYATSPRA